MENTNISKAKYEQLCKELENAKMFDGHGEYSGYRCEKCGYIVATLYKDNGVIPFCIRCPKCNGISVHEITFSDAPPLQDNISKVKNWVRPTYEQFVKLKPATKAHILNGGLIFEEEIVG